MYVLWPFKLNIITNKFIFDFDSQEQEQILWSKPSGQKSNFIPKKIFFKYNILFDKY